MQLTSALTGARVGRGRRHKGQADAEVDAGVGRLPGADDRRGADAEWRDGRVVQLGEEDGQVGGVGRHSPPHKRGDQG